MPLAGTKMLKSTELWTRTATSAAAAHARGEHQGQQQDAGNEAWRDMSGHLESGLGLGEPVSQGQDGAFDQVVG